MTRHVLLLGGTSEARALSEVLAGRSDLRLTVSLAGVTEAPAMYAGKVRVGGFGGAAGLADYIGSERVTDIIDATHPFAAQITENALAAANATGVPIVRLQRPAWDPIGNWHDVDGFEHALELLPDGASVFMATGRGTGLRLLARCAEVRFEIRMIEPPEGEIPGNVSVRRARPSGSVAEERETLRSIGASHMVIKNSGGPSRAKIDAAAELGLTILALRRPKLPATLVYRPDIQSVLRHTSIQGQP